MRAAPQVVQNSWWVEAVSTGATCAAGSEGRGRAVETAATVGVDATGATGVGTTACARALARCSMSHTIRSRRMPLVALTK